jgi:excinuclease ABC subunit A
VCPARGAISGVEEIDKVVRVDPSPIGRSPRSNPATYTGVFDRLRQHRYGDGTLKVEMRFLPDIYVPCEVCHGAQYNRETLDVHFKGRSIADVLGMTIEAGRGFFAEHAITSRYLRTLHDVGLGTVKRSTSSTSRPPACVSRTSATCWPCSTDSSTKATRSWSSSTTST